MLARQLLKKWSLEVSKSHHSIHKTFRSSFITLILRGTRGWVFDELSPLCILAFSSNPKIFAHLRSLFMSFLPGLICQRPSTDVSVCSEMFPLAQMWHLKFIPFPLSITDGCIKSEFCLNARMSLLEISVVKEFPWPPFHPKKVTLPQAFFSCLWL